MTKIDNTELETLSRAQQELFTIQDYLMYLVKDGHECVNINILAVMAGISDEITELRKEREANDGES